jgi:hypothetical protein
MIEDLRPDIFNHDKHYRALIGWMRRKKMTALDLCELFVEGSTVAYAIWKLYDVKVWPQPAQAYAASRAKERWISVQDRFPEREKHNWVLVTDGNEWDVALVVKGMLLGHRELEITHWQPLPVPPDCLTEQTKEQPWKPFLKNT